MLMHILLNIHVVEYGLSSEKLLYDGFMRAIKYILTEKQSDTTEAILSVSST